MKKIPDNFGIKVNAGFSLVDVMVGMVIALLGVIVIYQVFSVSEGIKRTTTSGGDALQNGASALFALERSLKQAGYGIIPAGTAKVAITAGAANGSDSIQVSYMPNWDYGPFVPDPTTFPSAVPAAGELVTETITVNQNVNQMQLLSDVNGVISDGIVLMKAQYGRDTNADGVVDTWDTTAAGNILAVRVAVVARSAQPEKPNATTGLCDTTISAPLWTGSAAVPLNLSANAGLAAGDDWKCYRYKTFENTVPLRN